MSDINIVIFDDPTINYIVDDQIDASNNSGSLSAYIQSVVAGLVSGVETHEIITSFPFQLTTLIASPSTSQLFINGVKQRYGLDYVINGQIVTWAGITLVPTDSIEIFY